MPATNAMLPGGTMRMADEHVGEIHALERLAQRHKRNRGNRDANERAEPSPAEARDASAAMIFFNAGGTLFYFSLGLSTR